jgi:triphosphoribosyl-dephospho-CoA synthase
MPTDTCPPPPPTPAATPGLDLQAARALLSACGWDVAVCKPGNVSIGRGGHRMVARQFLDSAQAVVPALCTAGRPVGRRVHLAMSASLAAAGCNTNLGIVLLAAPLLAAHERLVGQPPAARDDIAWRAALQQVCAALDRADAAEACAAIAMTQPGGLGRLPEHDVQVPPTLALQPLMALAAPRDRIAAQYRDGGRELFDIGLAAWRATAAQPPARRVMQVWLAWMASGPDSHIVRKHGEALAHTVMAVAQRWRDRLQAGEQPDLPGACADDWLDWDRSLKQAGLNPGTCADLTVATLLLAAVRDEDLPVPPVAWHGT